MPTQAKEGTPVEGTTTEASQIPFATAFEGSLGHTLVQMGGAVLAVVALILVLQKLAKRYRPGLGGRGKDVGIDVLSQRALGNRLSLLVVEAQGQTFLLGTSPQGISTLAELGRNAGGAVSGAPGRTSAPGDVLAMPAVRELRGSRFDSAASSSYETGEPQGRMSQTHVQAQTQTQTAPPASTSAVATGTGGSGARNAGKTGFARGALRSIAALAVSRRPQEAPRSGLADLEEAARIAREARARDEAATAGVPADQFDQQEFEREFRDKLRAIREKYQTLDEVEGRRA
ncbi:MAG: flagellar biosynthetic protein FliO [Candidatus Eisenbacteria bacterium]